MAKQENKVTSDKETGNTNPKVGNEIPLKTDKATPYPLKDTKPDQQPERYTNLRNKFPDLIDDDFSGTREQVIQRISQRKGITPLDATNILDGR